MFRNLEAEQARKGMTNTTMASKLNISQNTYSSRKKNGDFPLKEIIVLLELFQCTFEYLFEKETPPDKSA